MRTLPTTITSVIVGLIFPYIYNFVARALSIIFGGVWS